MVANDRAVITVSQSIFVRRSPIAVFDFTQDYDHRPRWDRFITDAEIVSSWPRRIRVRVSGVGRYTVDYRLFRRGARTSARFVDVDSPWLAGGGGSWRYEAMDDGTLWTQTNTFELKRRRLLGWAMPLVRMALGRSMRRAMAEARRLMEAGAEGRPAIVHETSAAARR